MPEHYLNVDPDWSNAWDVFNNLLVDRPLRQRPKTWRILSPAQYEREVQLRLAHPDIYPPEEIPETHRWKHRDVRMPPPFPFPPPHEWNYR